MLHRGKGTWTNFTLRNIDHYDVTQLNLESAFGKGDYHPKNIILDCYSNRSEFTLGSLQLQTGPSPTQYSRFTKTDQALAHGTKKARVLASFTKTRAL